GWKRSSPIWSSPALRSSVKTHASKKPSHTNIMSGTTSASTTRHPPSGKSTLPEARATSRYRIYNEPHPQITVDQPEPPPPRVVNRAGKVFSRGRPTAGPAGGSMPEDARKTRYTAQIKSGKLSAKPARSRSGVKPARTPCSKSSSKLSRDRVRSVRSVFPLSVFSARKPRVWLPVQASTVKVMSAETSRHARQTLRVAWRTRAACPGMSLSCFNASSGPWNTIATAKSMARPARKAQRPSMLGITWGEESVSPEHQRRNARDAMAAGFPTPVPAAAAADAPFPEPAACAQSKGIVNQPIRHLFPSLRDQVPAPPRSAGSTGCQELSTVPCFVRSTYDDRTRPTQSRPGEEIPPEKSPGTRRTPG